MNWRIKRNYDERRKLFELVQAMKEQERKELALVPDNLPDTEFYEMCDAIEKKYSTDAITLKIYALEYPETKNSWFINFVESFGNDCFEKRITEKQANVFRRYCEPEHETNYYRGQKYYVRSGNKFVKFTDFGNCFYIDIINYK